ncbi:MAG TPA: histidine kinase, partial [Bryobacteraceae bacterium]
MRDLKTQFVSALLFILTVAAVCCATINFRHQKIDTLPEDGVVWVDRTLANGQDVVQASHLTSGGEAENAGIHTGDILLEISGNPIRKSIDVPRVLQQIGSWSQARYSLRRGNVQLPAQVIIGERVPDRAVYYQYAVGAAYLLIGLFVYYRRVSAPRSVHFYVLCLLSFVLSCFHFTGKLNAFDQSIYWGNVAASIFAPTVFLHFCLVFPEPAKWLARRGSIFMVYAPGAVLLGIYVLVAKGMLRVAATPIEVNWFLDRASLLFLSSIYLLGTLVLTLKAPGVDDPLVRRQLKYVRNGALLGIVPFTAIYSIPYILGYLPDHYQKMAVLSLIL